MQAIVNIATSAVLILVSDSTNIVMTETSGLSEPMSIASIKPSSYSVHYCVPECPWKFVPNVYGYNDGQWFIIDYAAFDIIEDEMILEERNAKLSQINQWRLEANYSTFPFRGKEIACDALSRSDIDGVNGYVCLFNIFPHDSWVGSWKATDNTYIPIDTTEDWKELYKAMVDKGMWNFLHAQSLKKYLLAATTLEEIRQVTWEFDPAPPV